MCICLLNLWTKFRVKIRVLEQDGFYLRCHVYIEYQIMKNGRPHPAPFVRLPYIGPFNNWAETACLGLRATWKTTTGTWRSMWL
ncbi:hypothetical protein VC83_03967 [Pseudogymnoascus destructans]|uniref:Uncharacterized protein n=1 Tax=Pseudogymnoascus destructans TaxID=655981 RepID=A0A177AEJ3_9PEZI|nr:uncharacterized protein VC83_03967 [Pseudogymnoascus destructans]OAF59681.1 hypothetical protein VC83_03967 [Pseudogymnoascus destructans]